MREFVRDELPIVGAAGARLDSLVARSSTLFGVLAGIGAGRIGGDIALSASAAVLEATRLERTPRPYDFQQILGPALALVVARRAGGIGGTLGYLAYAGFVLVIGWIGRALSCAQIIDRDRLGSFSFCAYGPLDLIGSAMPTLIALALGGIVAAATPPARRAGSNALLEAAGAYAAPAVLFALGARAFVYQAPQPAPQLVAYIVGSTIVAGLLAGALCAARSATPRRTAIILAGLLVATWLYPLGWSQFAMTAGADWPDRPELLLFATPVLGSAVIVAVATMARRRTVRATTRS